MMYVSADLPDVVAPFRNPAQDLKPKYAQQHLALFIHAYKCQHDINNPTEQCPIRYCETMKRLLEHVMYCEFKHCPEPYCLSSRHIISHWKDCITTIKDCNICNPFKHMDEPKEWHQSITSNQRNSLVDLLLQIIASSTADTILGESTFHKVGLAMQMETEIYKAADSLVDYYRALAEKMRAVEEDVEESARWDDFEDVQGYLGDEE